VEEEPKDQNQQKEETSLDKWKYLAKDTRGQDFGYGMSLSLQVELHAVRFMKSGHCYAFSDLACDTRGG
jgi:hypothetical protein